MISLVSILSEAGKRQWGSGHSPVVFVDGASVNVCRWKEAFVFPSFARLADIAFGVTSVQLDELAPYTMVTLDLQGDPPMAYDSTDDVIYVRKGD